MTPDELPADMEARTPAPEGEAVAWRWRSGQNARWQITTDKGWLLPDAELYEVQPLYASPVVPVGVRERVLDELDKAWLHGQRRTSWRRDESADAILAALRPIDTGGRGEQDEAGILLTFGFGALIVNTGTFGGDNAVFIAKATSPGPVGEYTGRSAFARDCLQLGEHVLVFPTKEQAQAVADAMCAPIPPAPTDTGANHD